MILGMGPDGHTASLFPGHDLLKAKGIAACIANSPKPPPKRITLTLDMINASSTAIFVAAGDSKKEVLARVMEDKNVAWGDIPAKLISPKNSLIWFLDKPAGSLLKASL
mmetsp:Transcript_11271/g.12394  ORF Transcript_11271/g.12394 Transcript_11271/m.12394 type:complete len:109 (-) Transcript_11271:22-348(-)